MMIKLFSVVTLLVITSLFLLRYFRNRKKASTGDPEIPVRWKPLLQKAVGFYRNLSLSQREVFELDVARFLQEVKITGVGVQVELEDRLLVASSAVIPLFGFPAYTYVHLNEVLLYPRAFDRNFELDNPEEVITGMVGTGVMEGKMILSKPALHHGFKNPNDKSNVGIHEFVHLFDKEDGLVDGVPPGFDNVSFSVPWVDLVRKKITDINKGGSDINSYGATNNQEFFAVASEYFFENPGMMEKRHPELYEQLTSIFNQDLSQNQSKQTGAQLPIGRNSACPCGSGEKYKRCCL